MWCKKFNILARIIPCNAWWIIKFKFYILLFSFTALSAYGFQLDDLLNGPLSELQQDKINTGFFQCSYPNELISYDRKHKILGYPVREVILRFTSEKCFKAADIIVAYSVGTKMASRVQDIGNELAIKIVNHLKQLPKESVYIFPNGAKVNIKRWSQNSCRIYLFCRFNNDASKNKKFSLVFLRIEPTTIPEKSFVQMLRLKSVPLYQKTTPDGGKLLNVPMRSQLPDSKGCWFTSVARQLNYLGSEINSLTVDFIGVWANSKKNNLGKLLNFKRQIIQINNRSTVEKGCLQFIKNYNEAAQIAKQPTIPLLAKGNRWNDNMKRAKPDILAKTNLEFINPKQYRFFCSIIKKNIDKNIPVGWFVVRCIRGAHYRLIIGYNSTKDTLYYSDSWSPKTEIKEMPTICVYLMTRHLEIYTTL